MSRPRTPLAKARLTGADRKNPQRYRNRSEPDDGGPIGDPPAYLPTDARRLWHAFADELPWLRRADRAILESISLLRARVMLREDVSFAHMRELRCGLGVLAATPTSRKGAVIPANEADTSAWDFLDLEAHH